MSGFRSPNQNPYHTIKISDETRRNAVAAKKMFRDEFPEVEVSIEITGHRLAPGTDGFIMVDGKKAVNISGGRKQLTANDMLDKMKQSYLGEGTKTKITKRQLRRIIREVFTASPEGVISGEESDRSPSIHVDDRPFGTAPKRRNISPEVQDLIDMDDPDYAKQAFELSDTLQGYPEGTAQAAVDDEEYAMIMSKLASSPLGDIVNTPPKGFKFGQPGRGSSKMGDYASAEFYSDAGGLLIDISLVLSDNSLQINSFAYDKTDDVWNWNGGELIEDAVRNPDVAMAAINKIAADMVQKYPGL